MIVPYEWQEHDLSLLRAHNYTGLVAIETGGGKTITASLAIKDANPDVVLISSPGNTHKNAWPKHITPMTGRELRIIGNSNKATKLALADFELGVRGIYLTTPQFMTRTDTSLWSGDMLIVDEIHELSTAKSAGQRVLSGWDRRKDGEPLNTRFDMRIAMSGSPMRQNFQNFWGVMRFLWPDLYRRGDVAYDNFYMWCQDRMTSEQVYTSQKDRDGNTKKVTNYLVEEDPGRLLSEMPLAIVHKRREECCKWHAEFPGFLSTKEPQEIINTVALHPKQTKAIHELEKSYMTWLEDNPLVVELPMTLSQRIRQICLGVPRVEWFSDVDGKEHVTLQFDEDCESPFLDETLNILSKLTQDEPVVVFLESQRFADVVVKRLTRAGYPAQEYSGKSKADLLRFGKDYQILVGVIAAIGTGTDGLGDNCQTEIRLETPSSVTKRVQSEARLDRMGAKGQVQRYVILDETGYAEGHLNSSLQKQLTVNKSMRRVQNV